MKLGIAVFILIFPAYVFSQGTPVPHIFVTGEPIVASEFNANFQELADRNEATQSETSQNSTDIATLQGTLSQIQADLGGSGAPLAQFVGFSSGAINGGQGIKAMTELCQVDYVESRVCDTEEYVKTMTFPVSNNGSGWISPSRIVGGSVGVNGEFHALEVYSSQLRRSSSAAGLTFNCLGWNDTGATGLIVTGTGQLNVDSCSVAKSVSCCK